MEIKINGMKFLVDFEVDCEGSIVELTEFDAFRFWDFDGLEELFVICEFRFDKIV